MEMTPACLAGMIDHTLLSPGATSAGIGALCAEAAENGFHAVCVNPSRVALAYSLLKGTGVLVCSVVGFPLGASRSKPFETSLAISDGAGEVDMVMDIGALLDGDTSRAVEDVARVVEAASGLPVKVIIEACLLTDSEKLAACAVCEAGGATFVKTSTGFSSGGATAGDVRLIRRAVGDRLRVKASGGIADLDTALSMIGAGADRLGLSRSVRIMGEMRLRAAGGVVQPPAEGSDSDSCSAETALEGSDRHPREKE